MTYADLMLSLLFSTVQPCPKRLTYQSSTQTFQGQSPGHTRIQPFLRQGNLHSLESGLKLTEGLDSPPVCHQADKSLEGQGTLTVSTGAEASTVSPSSWSDNAQLLDQ